MRALNRDPEKQVAVNYSVKTGGRAPLPGDMGPFAHDFGRKRNLCVADGECAKEELGFAPGYTTREAVLEFGASLRLREARLLTEAYA